MRKTFTSRLPAPENIVKSLACYGVDAIAMDLVLDNYLIYCEYKGRKFTLSKSFLEADNLKTGMEFVLGELEEGKK